MADSTSDNKTNIPEGAKTVPPKGKTSGNKTVIIVIAVVTILFVIPAIALAVFFGWLASGDNAEKLTENVIEQSTGGDVDINADDGSFSIQTDEGSVEVGGDQQLPEDLPTAVIIYNENEKVIGVVTNTQDTSKYWSVTVETTDSTDTVNSFIESKFEENGWTTSSKTTFDGSTSYTFEKEDLQAVIAVSADEGKTNISYYISQEPQQ